MKKQVCEQLTLYQEDSLANRFPWLESKKEKGMIVIYGRKCSELSESLRRVGSSVRMYLESCELPLPTLYRTWSVKAMTSRCLILKLRLSERRTEEKELHLWPTPKASDAIMGMTAKTSGRPIEKSTHLQTKVYCAEKGLIPTPRSHEVGDYQYSKGDHSKPILTLTGYTKLLPTPRCGGSRGNSPAGAKHGDLAGVCGGQLNPTWVEWLMGFPTGWTDLDASEMQ